MAVPQDLRWGRTYECFSESTEIVAALGAAEVERPNGADGDKAPGGSEDSRDDEAGARAKRRKLNGEPQQVNTYSLQEEGILKATLQCFEAIISKQTT